MTFATSMENFFETTEADVLKVLTSIKSGAMIFESDLASGLKWLAAQEPAIVSEVQGALSIATDLGIASNPEVAAVASGAQLAITALQAITKSVSSGASSAATLVAGYVAVKTASAAVQSTTAAVINAPTPAPVAASG